MSKEIKNSVNLLNIKEKMNEMDVVFLPSPPQRRAKSKFWVRYDSLLGAPETLSSSDIANITQEPTITKWWSQPYFKEWFLNKEEEKERLDYLYNLGLDSLEQLFLNPEANHNARVNALKVIALLASKEPSKNEKFSDEDIQRMDKIKLRAYIQKYAPLLIEDKPNKSDKDGEN